MEIIAAAALIAVGIVVAAVVAARVYASAAAGRRRPKPIATAATGSCRRRRGTETARSAPPNWRREREARSRDARPSSTPSASSCQRAARGARRASSSGCPGMSASRAKQMLLKEVEEDARQDAARLIRQIEEDTRRDAERRVRNILSVCMQRLAAGHAAETTVSVVQLASDDLKGRIIGREGRNIRVLENLTGVDFIIDDTPGAVVLSGFDGVRREIARTDAGEAPAGRPDPPGADRGDLLPGQVRARGAHHRGRRAGRVRGGRAGPAPGADQAPRPAASSAPATARTCSPTRSRSPQLAAMMAAELGAGAKTARRAALLHDIGKAVTHEVEGPHALVARRAGAQVRRDRGGRPRDGGPPQRGRAADDRGGHRAGRRRPVRRAPGRPR